MYIGFLVRDGGVADKMAEDAAKGFPVAKETIKNCAPTVVSVAVTHSTGQPIIGAVAKKLTEFFLGKK